MHRIKNQAPHSLKITADKAAEPLGAKKSGPFGAAFSFQEDVQITAPCK